jgi:acyl-CoA synthetase (AMP-forming)/AMP-acid ligase II
MSERAAPGGPAWAIADETGRPPSELTDRDLWHWRVEATPERPWLRFEGREWTYREFDLEVRALAGGIAGWGVRQGDRVLVGMVNSPATLRAHLALAELGAVVIPLMAGSTTEELCYSIDHCEAAWLIASEPIAAQILAVAADRPHLRHIAVAGAVGQADAADVALVDFDDLAAASPIEHLPLPGHDTQSLAYVLYTSGSTGRPKGVMLKAGAMYSAGLGYSDRYAITGDDTYFLPLTLAHALGALAATGIPMLTGGCLALCDRFSPRSFWADAERGGATVAVLFAAHLNLLLEVDQGEPAIGEVPLRLVITHADHPRFRERFGVEMGTVWGMTETLICSGSEPGYRGELDPGYIGRPWPGGELGVFDAEGNRLPPGELGELWLRHPQTMHGYLGDPEQTAATLVDGWVRSGDQAVMDHSGRAYFVGRFKAMIKRSGENVSAEEVEATLAAHPDVLECAVIGVPDPIRSEEVAALVVARRDSELDPGALRAASGERLTRWKLPRYIAVSREPLPRLGNGKVDRTGIAESYSIENAWDAEKVG